MISEASLADLRARNPVAEVARKLGATLRKSGRSLIGDCPLCGYGKSGPRRATRFEVKSDEVWVCAACGTGGDAIRLVELNQGLTFLQAVEWLGGAHDIDPVGAAKRDAEIAAKKAKREAESARYREAERRRLYALWRDALPFSGTSVEAYLRGRGIDDLDGVTVRYAPEASYYHGEVEDERGFKHPRLIHTGPAMLAPFVDGAGVFRGLHLTWIDPARPGEKAAIVDPDTGECLPAKKMRGSKAGCWLKLERQPIGKNLAIGEGIETTLSARVADDDRAFSYAAAGDLGNLTGPATETIPHPTRKTPSGRPERVPGPEPDLTRPGLPIPDYVERLRLLGDGDSDPYLTDLAIERAVRRYAQPGRVVTSIGREQIGNKDLNDVLRGVM